jgi:hypothetical protein
MLRLLHRVVLVLALASTVSGCSVVQRILKGTDPKTFSTARALMKDGRYIEAADELRSLQAEYGFKVRMGNGRSLYGELVGDVAQGLASSPLSAVESAAKSDWTRAEAFKLAAQLPANFKALEGLPLDELKVERFATKTLNERRAKVEAQVAELVAGAEKQAALIREDERAGRVGFALYEWSRFRPATDDQARERKVKLLELARALFAAAGGTFSLDVDKDAAKNLDPAVVEGRRIAQGRLETVTFVAADKADAAIAVGAKEPQVKRSTSNVTLEWRYPTGKRQVPNPDIKRLQEKIAYADKQAAYYRSHYNSIVCSRIGNPRGRVKAPSGDCAKTEYSSWQKYMKDGETARKSLSRTKPTKTETVYSTYPYEAREDVVTVEQPLAATITYRDGRKERVTKVAAITLKAYTHAGHAPVKLKARAEKLPQDGVVLGTFQPTVREQMFEFVKSAQKGLLAGQKASLSADAGADVKSAELDLRSRAQAMFRKDDSFSSIEQAAKTRLGSPVEQEYPTMPSLFERGTKSLTWDRLVGFAEAEEAEKRLASAYVTWVLTPSHDDATKAQRSSKLADLKSRLTTERTLAWTIDAPDAAAALGAKVGELLAPLPGFPKATGTPRLTISISAPSPKPARESGDVTLEHEYVASEEVVDNPAFEESMAKREACRESGGGLCAALDDIIKPPPETIVQKNMEQVSYRARREAAEMAAEVAVKATWDGRELAFTLPVEHTVEAFTHAGRTDVKLEARAQKLGTDAELVAAWQAVAAQAVFDALFAKLHPTEGGSAGARLDAAILAVIRRKAGVGSFEKPATDVINETLGVSPFRSDSYDMP